MKYKLTNNTKQIFGKTLYQIEALKDFGNVKKGELGGWIEKEDNLSQEDDAWVSGYAIVYGNARVYDDAWVYDYAIVYGNARVYGNAWVSGYAIVYGDAIVSGSARVYGNARVYDKIKLDTGEYKDYKPLEEAVGLTYEQGYERGLQVGRKIGRREAREYR